MDATILDPETERLLEIPAFLDRRKWTDEQKAEYDEQKRRTERQFEADAKRRRNLERKARDRAIRAAQIEREAKAQAKADRRQEKERRKARNVQRRQDRNRVVELIDAGHVTIGQMVKASGIPAERLKPAIRWLLRHERISKATPRTYSA